MEWVSYLAGEPHTDQPACVSPALRAFCVALNDGLERNTRQRLRPFLARTIGTTHDGLDEQRAWMAIDWLIRVYTPAWLELAGVTGAARGLTLLAPVQGVGDLAAAGETLEAARRDARTARQAARGSHIARALPSAAERSARRQAWATGEPAVWVITRIPVAGAAGQRVCEQVRAAAGDGAAAVSRQARAGSRSTNSRAAARGALVMTITALQQSAFALLERMLPTQTLTPPSADATDDLAAAYG